MLHCLHRLPIRQSRTKRGNGYLTPTSPRIPIVLGLPGSRSCARHSCRLVNTVITLSGMHSRSASAESRSSYQISDGILLRKSRQWYPSTPKQPPMQNSSAQIARQGDEGGCTGSEGGGGGGTGSEGGGGGCTRCLDPFPVMSPHRHMRCSTEGNANLM